MKIDLFIPSYQRAEFALEMAKVLAANTNWKLVNSTTVVNDGPADDEAWKPIVHATNAILRSTGGPGSGPVAATNVFLDNTLTAFGRGQAFVKLDTDVVVPPHWLDELIDLAEANPAVDFIGIEAMHEARHRHELNGVGRHLVPAAHIGGIGLFRYSAFEGRDRPQPNGRFGFTEWQHLNPTVKKAWINPAIPIVLLDHLPGEPWASLSAGYEAKRWQRRTSPNYTEKQSAIFDWYVDKEAKKA